MRPIILLFLIAGICQQNAFAQDIPGGDFEQWQDINGYEEPVGPMGNDFWGSNNQLSLLGGGPITTVKETDDVHTGNYAVKLVSQYWDLDPQPLAVAAVLASGYFEANLADFTKSLRLGRPWTSRPKRFKGYYKYLPQDGDQCAIYAQLTRYNSNTGQKDTIAEASLSVTETMTNYELFDLPFEYRSEQSPDSIIVVFTPSAYGFNFEIGDNSTLLIDDVSLSYEGLDVSIVGEPSQVQLFPNPGPGYFQMKGETQLFDVIQVYNAEAALVLTMPIPANISSIDLRSLPPGQYLYQLQGKSNTQSGLLQITK